MAENPFQEIGGAVFSRIFSSILWVGLGIIIIGVLCFLMWYFLLYQRKFDIKVKIISNRAEDKNSVIFDKAAILTDRKTKTAYFRVWGLKRDFPVPKYNVLQRTNKGDYLEIYRKSENDFYFLTPPQINNKRVIKSDGKLYAFSDQDQVMVDPEMGFWAVKRKTINKKMFDTDSILMKVLPYIPHIIGGMIMIFVLYILMDHLPGILGELRQLVAEMRNIQTANVVTG